MKEVEHVYIVGEPEGPVKIGYTKDLRSRIGAIKTGYPHPMDFIEHMEMPPKEDGLSIERAMHSALKDHRLRGEWFDITGEHAVDVGNKIMEERGYVQISCRKLEKLPTRERHPQEPTHTMVSIPLENDLLDAMTDEWLDWERRINQILRPFFGLK